MFYCEDNNTSIKIEKENNCLLSYQGKNGEIIEHTKSVLLEVNSSLYNDLNKHFNVDVSNYGVSARDKEMIFTL